MKVVIDINEKDYNDIMFDVETSPRLLNRYEWLIAHGRPLPRIQADMLAKIREEIKEYKSRQLTLAIGVDDLEKGKQIAIEYVLSIIDKYVAESKEGANE